MRPTLSVLALLGNPIELEGIVGWIRQRGQAISIVLTGEEGVRAHRQSGADLVILALPLPDMTAADVLRVLRAQDPRVAIIVIGTDRDIQVSSDAFALGADEHVRAASATQDLLFALGMALGVRSTDVQLRFLRTKDAAGAEWQALVGDSPAMRRVVSIIRQVCDRSGGGIAPTLLLTGETGTGKGLVAKSIHYNGARRSRAFVDVNCAAIPAALLESELFGHEKGAFTDARSTRIGLFETADGGTLFLDEIGAMPFDLQSKILIAIEDKKIRRLGGRESFRVDVQIVAATHADLGAMVKREQFRADLYHRLNVVAIDLPPLRERGDDVLRIAESMIATIAGGYGMTPPELSDDAKVALLQYSWPGNVRELRNELERILLLVDDKQIRSEHFRFSEGAARGNQAVVEVGDAGLSVSLMGDRCPLEDLEREVIRQALVRCRGNVARTARYLGVTRQTLVYRLKKHGLASPSSPDLLITEDES